MSIFRNFGIDFVPANIWSSGNDVIITVLMCVISLFLICVGIVCVGDYKIALGRILRMNTIERDYFSEMKENCYINMGVMGIFTVAFVLLLRVQLSGPVLGGVFTIIGFGCCGKRLGDMIPLMMGAMIAAFLSRHEVTTPAVVITILFATCLSPITDSFGVLWAVLAGFLHLNIALNLGIVHGGLNLYNNGLAGGFTAMILVPIIRAMKSRDHICVPTDTEQDRNLNGG